MNEVVLTAARWIIILSGIWLLAVSAVMLLRPAWALRGLGKMASTHLINYTELLLRLAWGVAMLSYAGLSRLPAFTQIFGMLLTVTAVVLLLLPRAWHATYASYWAGKLTEPQVRSLAPVSIAVGLLLIWTVA